jgi:2-iminobutanoate/2-iminopropanoate deaminase
LYIIAFLRERKGEKIKFVAYFYVMKQFAFLFLFVLPVTFMSCNSSKKLVVVESKNAPKVIGPYSHAIKVGNLIYTSGQIGLSPATNALAGTDITAQTTQTLDNLKVILLEAGSDMSHVIKVTVFLKDLNDYTKVNEIYAGYFPEVKPARSAVQVARLPKDALVEIECVATTK